LLAKCLDAVPMRRVKDIEMAVLTRPGCYRKVADSLAVKEVWVGVGGRRKRYVLCFNPAEAERQQQHRLEVLTRLVAELKLPDERTGLQIWLRDRYKGSRARWYRPSAHERENDGRRV
jgi:hypothetical protein